MIGFVLGMAVGVAVRHYWPQVKAKLITWYDAVVAKI